MKRFKIFISSVQKEFTAERALLCDYIREDALLGQYFEAFIFERSSASDRSAKQVYMQEVECCDIYLGILGTQYGYRDSKGISPTEQEYDCATKLGKRRLIYIRHVPATSREPEEQRFIHKVEQDVTRKSFDNAEGLRSAVYASLIRFLQEKGIIHWTPFDAACDNEASFADLDEEKMQNFIDLARAKRNFPLPPGTKARPLLQHLNLLGERNKLRNAALMLFGSKPQKFFATSEVKCVQFYGTEVEKPAPSIQIYKGDVFTLVDQATSFVMGRIDNWVGTRSEGASASVPTRPELPMEAVKEAIVNAICHRDYNSSASVQVMLFRDRLEICNPGFLPEGLTIPKLNKAHASRPANPLLADPLFLSGYIEKMGTGTVDIVRKCAEYGLRAPEFRQEDGFRVIIWRPKQAQSDPNTDPNSGPNDPNSDPNLDPNKIAQLLDELRQDGTLSRKLLATHIGLSERQVRNIQDLLMAQGKLERAGSTRGRWIVLEKGTQTDPNAVPNDPNLDPNPDPNRVTMLLEELRRDGTLSRKELATRLGISDRQVRHLLNALQERGHLRREGSTTRGKWVVLTPINGGNNS